MHQNEQNKTDDNIKKLQQPNSLYFILNEPKEIFFNPLKKIKLGENNDLITSIQKIKIHNLLSPEDYTDSDSKKYQKKDNYSIHKKDFEGRTHNFFQFNKDHPLHIEKENLNQIHPNIFDNDYLALKIQETTFSARMGQRIIKMQTLTIHCPNLQFLELFSCKQLVSFSENQLFLPNLKTLRLLMLNKLNNESLYFLINSSKHLEQIFLIGLQSITMVTLPRECQKIQSLEICECKSLEKLYVYTSSLQDLSISDGKNIQSLLLNDSIMGLYNLTSLRILGCPKLSLDFLYNVKIGNLKKLELISNAPSAKAYTKVNEIGFDQFIFLNCHHLQEINLDKIHNISLNGIMAIISQCKSTLLKVIFDLNTIEKPKVREALRHCTNLKDWKVEKWYIKKKWTEW